MIRKDLISLLDFEPDEIRALLALAADCKARRLKNENKVFSGRTGVLIFEKPSLRTRITFETALYELGGQAINLESTMVRMGERETVEDVARNLERWVHLVIARTYAHDTVVQLARYSRMPVINALTDQEHPCQALAFGLTIREHRGDDSQNIVFVGDGNNVCSALMILSVKLGYDFTVACPAGYEPPADLVQTCQAIASKFGRTVAVTQDPYAAVRRASAIYTDVWASMGQEDEALERKKIFTPYAVNEKLIARAPSDVLVSHCLPAHRDEEIQSEVLDSARSIAFDEAENRLHAQKAMIIHLFSQVSL
jgi:ornithine carbamoyltransferase